MVRKLYTYIYKLYYILHHLKEKVERCKIGSQIVNCDTRNRLIKIMKLLLKVSNVLYLKNFHRR